MRELQKPKTNIGKNCARAVQYPADIYGGCFYDMVLRHGVLLAGADDAE